jgi:thioredoxin-related protein
MNARILFVLLACLSIRVLSVMAISPDVEGSLVRWMSVEEVMRKIKTNPKPVLMDFYTSWCGWCKHMMKTTYADPGLAQYINTYFYPVKFDAEGKDTIEFLGKEYFPGGLQPRATHTLTSELLKTQLMYPTTLFMNNYDSVKNEFGINMIAQGYLERKKMEPMLVFQVENVYRSSSFDDFNVQFEKAFYDSTVEKLNKKLNWLPAKQFFTTTPVANKMKTVILINSDWCNSCRVMKRASFTDSSVFNYFQNKFNLVEFNAQSNDTLFFKGQYFNNPTSSQFMFHPLAISLSRNRTVLPTMVVLDEEQNPIDAISYYISPGFLSDILLFYGDNIYKTRSWKDFQMSKKEDQQ